MNPHAPYPTSPAALLRSVYQNRSLIRQMIQREVTGRYRGSILGITWSFFQPLLMLAVYTFVFSVVMQTSWRGDGGAGKVNFAIVLFSGLIVHSLFAESVNRAPTLILSNVNLVKRVVFPLEILSVVAVGVALFNFLVGVVILLAAMILSGLTFQLTALYLPLIIIPLVLVTLAITWFLAAMGVYLRDLCHVVVVMTTVLLFLSPVFYSISAVPEPFRKYIYLNPLSFVIEQVRAVLLWGMAPEWTGMLIYWGLSLLAAWLGFYLFQWSRKGFSDVL